MARANLGPHPAPASVLHGAGNAARDGPRLAPRPPLRDHRRMADASPLFDEVLEALQADPAVRRGMTFGHRAAKIGRKVFACDADGDLVVKLGRERVDELVNAGRAVRFDPMGGRPMRDWAQVPAPDGDVRPWVALAEEAKLLVADG